MAPPFRLHSRRVRGRPAAWPSRGGCAAARGFTMVELMIVIAIAAMIMMIGVPSAFKALRKDPLRQAISDVVDACNEARAQAVLKGLPAEVRLRPQDRTLTVVTGLATTNTLGLFTAAQAPVGAVPETPSTPATGSSRFSAELAEGLLFEMVDVNYQEYKDAEEARVRFYPNGTSDLFTLVLHWPERQQYRKISLDIMTGLSEVEVIR